MPDNPYAGTAWAASWQAGYDDGVARPYEVIEPPSPLSTEDQIVYSEGVLTGQSVGRAGDVRSTIRAARFQGDAELVQVLNGEHRMQTPEQSESVRRVQEALIELGYAIPDGATGYLGSQTSAAVVDFKTRNAIYPNDAVVGPKTMARLDWYFSEGGSCVGPTPAPPESMKRVQVWLNAFIINSVGGLVPRPGHPDELMVHGLPVIGDCFATDDRDFSPDITQSARCHAEIVLDFSSGVPTVTTNNYCSPSFEYDCEDGELEGSATASASRVNWGPPDTITGSVVSVSLVGAVSNPLVTGSADIDFEGTLTVDPGSRVVSFDGLVDEFPAFEMYARADEGMGHKLFQIAPAPGRGPMWNLPGGANVAVSGGTYLP